MTPRPPNGAGQRAAQGHPRPFNLKYIGIGNEDLISKTFEERYLMIVKAVKEKYPDIVVCGTAGPWSEGSDYEAGWRLAKDHHIDMIDEHYYQTPGWFIHHQDYYDHYDRNASKVYLGEYAAHVPGRHNNIETALCEAPAHLWQGAQRRCGGHEFVCPVACQGGTYAVESGHDILQ